MTNETICKGCYLWENHLEGHCNYDPLDDDGNIICPCVECLVKCVCGQDIDCLKYVKAFITG